MSSIAFETDHPESRLYTVAYLKGEPSCVGSLLASVDGEAHRRAELFRLQLLVAQETDDVADWRRFFVHWQEILAAAPTHRPLFLGLTATHLLIADMLEQVHDVGNIWITLLLPCRECGCVFEVRRRGGRYRRSCGECRAPLGTSLLVRPHPRSEGLQHGGLIYPRWHPSSPLARAIAVDSVRCAHPGCDRSFTTTRASRDYCDEHQSGAAKQSRHRRRFRP